MNGEPMPQPLPAGKPRLSNAELEKLLRPFNLDRDRYPVIVVGIRGYYKNTMGAPKVNDRGIYDDALFIHSPSVMAAYNGNTDPSRYRSGHGTGENTKGIASLNPGAWFVHKFAKHKNQYLALCQRLGPVTVTRDGNPPYEDSDLNRPAGYFGINIHRGGYNGTSSLGCQTIHPTQWDSFINLAVDQAKRYHGDSWNRACIPYILIVQS
jgi:hypothetical protein